MANTKAVYARIDSELKENAERILSLLGITPSSAISMFYSQIVMQGGMPINLKVRYDKPLAAGAMTEEELDAAVNDGLSSAKLKTYSADEVDKLLGEEFGI